MKQVIGLIKITTLTNRQFCVILDPADKDGRPQMGTKKLIKVCSISLIYFILT